MSFTEKKPGERSALSRRDRPGQTGFSLAETLVVLVFIALIAAMTGPSLTTLSRASKLRSAAVRVQTLVRYARINAVKEKIGYRVVFHDLDDAKPNVAELQNDAGGSFATLPGRTYPLDPPVQILGSGSTDSMDNLTVNGRGRCTAGRVYLQAPGSLLMTITIDATCGIDVSV